MTKQDILDSLQAFVDERPGGRLTRLLDRRPANISKIPLAVSLGAVSPPVGSIERVNQ